MIMTSTPLISRYYLDLHEGDDDESEAEKEALESADWAKSTAIRSRFDSRHFGKACQVIRALRNPKKKLARPIFADDEERILTYELTVSILKYASFLNQALEASEFYKRNPNYKKENNEDVLVVLYDLFERDFQTHRDDPILSRRFELLQHAILGIRTKIMAHLARLRIQHQATTVNHLLPENLRHQKHIDQNPIYGWVNVKKAKIQSVLAALNQSGFQRSEFEDDILIQEDCYYVDQVHTDLIRFHSSRKESIYNSSLVNEGNLVVQDKSTCIAVYTLVRALFFRENMNRDKKLNANSLGSNQDLSPCLRGTYLGVPISVPPPEDWFENILETGKREPRADCVIVTHGGSGRTVAHLACLLQESVPKWLSRNTEMSARDDLATAINNKFVSRPPLNVIAFGVPDNKLEEITRFLKKNMLLANVKLFSEDFMSVSPKDPRIKNACAIIVNPPSSGSALKDPVAYICTEGGDEDVLLHLSKFVHTQTDPDTAQKYTSSQAKFLRHALNFPQAKLLLYTTCSLLPVENGDVVDSAIRDFHHEYIEHKIKIFSDVLHDKKSIRFYRDIHLELVPLAQVLDSYPKSNFNGPFMEMPPSSASSGCFLALIRRKETLITIEKHIPRGQVNSHAYTPVHEGEFHSHQRDSSDELPGTSGSGNSGLNALGFHLINMSFQNTLVHTDSGHSTASSVRSSRSAGAESRHTRKRSMTKKAIVQRVSIPTHSSLAKQTRKWTAENRDGSVGRRPGSRASCDHSHTFEAHNPDEHFGCVCHICARHAKKFPEFRPK